MGFVDKKQELKRYFPAPFYKLQEGQGLSILLDVYGSELNRGADDVQNARDQLLLSTASGKYLEFHGVNLDVFKPRGYKMPDNTYRQLIEIVTNSPKNIERIFERILALYFGESAIANGVANIYSYRPNEVVVEIQANALIIASSRDLYGTTYLHRAEGAYDGPSSDLWTGTLDSFLPKGSTSLSLSTLPSGIPTDGIIHFGSSLTPDEIKNFTRTGNVLTFTPTAKDHNASIQTSGPKFV